MNLPQGQDQEARKFIEQIHEHVIIKFDFDGVLVDSEKVAAAVTVRSVNKHLEARFGRGNFEPLTEAYVFNNLSGLNFEKQQIPEIEALYDVKFSDQLKADKKAGNLTALKQETEAIDGVVQFLEFIRDHHLNAIGVTQSDADRVAGTLLAPGCAEIASYIGMSLADEFDKNSNKIFLLSAGSKIEWNGRIIEKLKSKPDPEGYNLAHEIASAKTPRLKNIPTIVFEDSETGAKAAVAHINALNDKITDKVGIVSLGGHVSHDADHVDKMLLITGHAKAVVIDRSKDGNANPWIPGAIAALELALVHARFEGVTLPATLPEFVINHVVKEMNAVKA